MDDGTGFCDTVGRPAGCTTVDRTRWARRPAGWRPAPAVAPDPLGTSGGVAPTGPVRVADVHVWTFTFATREQGLHLHQPLVHEGTVFAVSNGDLHALALGPARCGGRSPSARCTASCRAGSWSRSTVP